MQLEEYIEQKIKEHSYKIDHKSGSRTYELGENDIKHVSKLIAEKTVNLTF